MSKVLELVFWKFPMLAWAAWYMQLSPSAWNSQNICYKTFSTTCRPRLYISWELVRIFESLLNLGPGSNDEGGCEGVCDGRDDARAAEAAAAAAATEAGPGRQQLEPARAGG